MVKIHQSGYQLRDYEVIDYGLVELPGTSLLVRGPIPNLQKPYFVAVGAAQTFGCFTEQPYPLLVSDYLNLPCLNLGFGGVGPEFFLRNPSLIQYINKSSFCILQIMSGRSVSNSRIVSLGSEYGYDRHDGRRKSTHKIFQSHIDDNYAFFSTRFGKHIDRVVASINARIPFDFFTDRLVRETRVRWIDDYIRLSYEIHVPTLLLWFSVRRPCYRLWHTNHDSLFGSFPQLVNERMVKAIKQYYGPYVESINSKGLPQKLINRFNGQPAICRTEDDRNELAGNDFSVNYYYPSPEMHAAAFHSLVPVINNWKSYLLP